MNKVVAQLKDGRPAWTRRPDLIEQNRVRREAAIRDQRLRELGEAV